MIVATYGPTSPHVGKQVVWQDGKLLVDGLPLTPQQVLDFDARGELQWAYDGLREWVVGLIEPPTAPTPPVDQVPPQEAAPTVLESAAEDSCPADSINPPPIQERTSHTRRNVIIGAVVALAVVSVAAAAIGSSGANKPSDGSTEQTGISGLAGVTTPAATDAATAEATAAPSLTKAAYMQKLTNQRAKMLKVLAWVARTGAAGKINSSAFDSLSSVAEDTLSAWAAMTPPTSVRSLNSRWMHALRTADDVGTPYASDLRGTRNRAMRCLAAFEALGVPGQSGTCSQIAANLQRGLWVMSATAAFETSCQSISFKVLDKDAGSLKGRHYVIRGQVFQIQDAGAGQFWDGYPDGLEPRTSMLVAVTDEGYGMWDDNVAVAVDGAVKHVYENDIVTVWGTCVGQYSYTSVAGYDETVPLIHARIVAKQ